MFSTSKHIYFVGIGGAGMSGIAEILLSQGFAVSGSDMHRSDISERLESLGARVFQGHAAEQIHGADVIVYSSAVKPDENPEILEAKLHGIPVLRRAEMLAETSRLNYCVAVAGTHGKTTTTSMCGLTLMGAGFDPTVIVGGRLSGFGGANARLGQGKWTVVEADEYDRSFLQLAPTIAVVTNVEAEHLDIYGTEEEVRKAFVEFANKVPFYGMAVLGVDDAGVREILPHINKKVLTFGLSRQADYHAADLRCDEHRISFSVYERGEFLGDVDLNVPGEHNVKNALAAIAVARELGAKFSDIQQSMKAFGGVYRRFEIKGERDGVLIVDDYAHHPTEVRSALSAARHGWNNRRIVVVFQPHTYSRTRDFYREFACSFDEADMLYVTDIYAAREEPIPGVSGELIAETTRSYGHKHVQYVADSSLLTEMLHHELRDGDILITLGAGDVWKISNSLAKK